MELVDTATALADSKPLDGAEVARTSEAVTLGSRLVTRKYSTLRRCDQAMFRTCDGCVTDASSQDDDDDDYYGSLWFGEGKINFCLDDALDQLDWDVVESKTCPIQRRDFYRRDSIVREMLIYRLTDDHSSLSAACDDLLSRRLDVPTPSGDS